MISEIMDAAARPQNIGRRLSSFGLRKRNVSVRQDISCDLGCSKDESTTQSSSSSSMMSPEDDDALFMQLEGGLVGSNKQLPPSSFFRKQQPRNSSTEQVNGQESSLSQSTPTVSSAQEYIWSSDGNCMVPDAPLGE